MLSLFTDKIMGVISLALFAGLMLLWAYHSHTTATLRENLAARSADNQILRTENTHLASAINTQNAKIKELELAAQAASATAKASSIKETKHQSVWRPKYDALQLTAPQGDDCADVLTLINSFYSLRQEEAQ